MYPSTLYSGRIHLIEYKDNKANIQFIIIIFNTAIYLILSAVPRLNYPKEGVSVRPLFVWKKYHLIWQFLICQQIHLFRFCCRFSSVSLIASSLFETVINLCHHTHQMRRRSKRRNHRRRTTAEGRWRQSKKISWKYSDTIPSIHGTSILYTESPPR